MLASILLLMVYMYICFTTAQFPYHLIRCPGDTLERSSRGRALCMSVKEYHCLYDNFFNLAEICTEYKQLPKGTYPRVSIGGNIFYESCIEETFQHGPPRSYHITDCLSQKSKCVSEGQIPCKDGTPSTDSSCRCDYRNGFKSVSDKSDTCCSPTSMKDCSCHRLATNCSEDQEFDRDYNCISKCQSGFHRLEGSINCTRIAVRNPNEKTYYSALLLKDLTQYTKEYSYFEFHLILYASGGLYVLQFLAFLAYATKEEMLQPYKFKLFPYLGINVGVFFCYGFSIFVKKDTTPATVLSICLGILLVWVALVIYIFCTSEVAESRVVYNEKYDIKIFDLLQAASAGDLDTLRNLKDEGYVDMEDTDHYKRSALHLAAIEGKVEAVKYILKYHMCYPDAKDRWNRSAADDIVFPAQTHETDPTPIYGHIVNLLQTYKQNTKLKPPKRHFREIKAIEIIAAAEKGEIDTLKRLNKLGTDMNLSNSIGRTALHAAAENGMKEAVDFLLDTCKVSPFVRWSKKRPIDLVPLEYDFKNNIRKKLQDKMNELLEEKCCGKINVRFSNEQVDPNVQIVRLLNAAARGDIQKMRLYYNSGYDMNMCDYDTRTALHVAVSDDQEHIVEFFLEKGLGDKHALDRWGNTPFAESTGLGKETVHQVFLKHCPELLDTENDQYRTYHLLSAGAKGDVETLRKLLAKKVEMDLRDYDGRTALHLAATEGKLDAVKFLIYEAKVKTNIPDRENRKPIDSTQDETIKKVLLETAANNQTEQAFEIPKITTNTETLLLVLQAAAKGYLHTLKANRFLYFPMDSSDYFKNTPLHIAAAKAKLEDVKYLLEKEVSPFVRNSFNMTPLQLVEEKIHYWNNREKVASSANVEKISKEGPSEKPIKNQKTRKQDFEAVRKVLQDSMNVGDNDVKEDEIFRKHNKDERIFLFLNKAYKGDIKAIKRYLKTDKTMIDVADSDKRTALHLAAAKRHIELVEFLLKQEGCKKDVTDRWGCKPLHEAMKNEDQDMMSLLND